MSESDYIHTLPPAIRRALCWRLTRADGDVFGFTDHDAPITFGGLTYEARSALEGSELSESLGLAGDDQDISGALSSDRITAADLIRGVYDGARVEIFDVNWNDAAARQLQGTFIVGEVGFRAEMRSEIARLGAKAGGRYIPECSATVGDARCGIDLESAAFNGSGTVATLLGDGFTVSGLGGFVSGWFARGVLTWTSGANDALKSEVRAFTAGIAGRALALWRDPPFPIEAGDHFTVTAGCDKTFATCEAKFGNGANFRGFPQMPGEGFAAEYAVQGDPYLDGGSRYR